VKYILLSSGNIPVDRKSKDRNILFRGTFDALAKGLAVALFPEGTSYTEPRIMQVKDGAAWAAMEYTSWALDNPGLASPLPITIVPAAIVYTNKSKYRSSVRVYFLARFNCKLTLTIGYHGVRVIRYTQAKILILRLIDLDDPLRWTLTRKNLCLALKEALELPLNDSLVPSRAN
jgi:Acyltransferase